MGRCHQWFGLNRTRQHVMTSQFDNAIARFAFEHNVEQAIHDGVQTCPAEVPKHEDIVLRLWRRLPEVEPCGSLRLSSGFLDLFREKIEDSSGSLLKPE